jgi:hypothetical protein
VCQVADRASAGCRAPMLEEELRVLKKLVLAAVAAGALAALRKRAGGKAEADLWHEATQGPQAVSTPSAR